MGETLPTGTPHGPADVREIDAVWLRQWLAQSASGVPIAIMSMLVLSRGALTPSAPLAGVVHLLLPFAIWVAALGALGYLLRRRTAAARAGWSGLVGTALAIAPIPGTEALVALTAALLAACQVGYAAVAQDLSGPRRIGFAVGGVLAALAGAAAVGLFLSSLRWSDHGLQDRAVVDGIVGGLIVAALVVSIVSAVLARRKGWAALAIVGLVVSALCVAAAAPQSPAAPEPAPYRVPAGPDGVDCETDPAPCGG
jgi:hypothetical protein